MILANASVTDATGVSHHGRSHVWRDLEPYTFNWADCSLPEVINESRKHQVIVLRGFSVCRQCVLVHTADATSLPVGLRDGAVLTLLAGLGLRGAEVAALRLDDLDWHRGEVLVGGKGARVEWLPLTVTVGAALAGYLTDARSQCEADTVFAWCCPPVRSLTGGSVRAIMARACRRAGLPGSVRTGCVIPWPRICWCRGVPGVGAAKQPGHRVLAQPSGHGRPGANRRPPAPPPPADPRRLTSPSNRRCLALPSMLDSHRDQRTMSVKSDRNHHERDRIMPRECPGSRASTRLRRARGITTDAA